MTIVADFHVHTTASDGSLSPLEVIRLAHELNLMAIAITDHDTTDGLPVALAAVSSAAPGLILVPGIELSCCVSNGEVHILGYWVSYTNPQFQARLRELKQSRTDRAVRMIEKLNDLGLQIDPAEVQKIAGTGSIGRPHLGEALIKAGYATSFREVFKKYLGKNGAAYVPRMKLTPEEAIKLILNSDGLPVLAHPGNLLNINDLREMIELGLGGIEVYHPDHSELMVHHLKKIAKEYRLLITGGSDFHGPNRGAMAPLGSYGLNYTLTKGFLQAKKAYGHLFFT